MMVLADTLEDLNIPFHFVK